MTKTNAVVCLPTRNEEKSMALMIEKIKSLNLPLFITDANSTDRTVDIAREYGVKNYERKYGVGKGSGMRTAIDVAEQLGYEVIVFLDCDCTYPPEEIPRLLSFLPEYDVVIGVRAKKNIPLLRRLPNLFHTLVLNVLFFSNLHDINSGMRALKINKMKNLTAESFDIEAEMSCKAIKRKLKIKEIPIEYHERIGVSSVRIRDGLLILFRILKERFN